MPRRSLPVLSVLFAVFALAAPARADLLISVQDAFIPAGGSGYIDVLITSDNPNADTLTDVGYEFQITPVTASGRLEFDPTQPTDFVDHRQTPADPTPDYVFVGVSGGPSFVGAVSQTNLPNDTIDGGDTTTDGLGNSPSVALPAGSPRLLVRLKVVADGSAPPSEGSTFRIALNPTSGDGSPSNASFFLDSNTGANVAFTSLAGTVTIVNAVPEPGSLACLAIGGIVLGLRRRRSGR